MSTLASAYADFYRDSDVTKAHPNEYVVRIFRGRYPNLQLSEMDFSGKRLLDVGFGDGRNFLALAPLGFELHGVELSEDICERAHSGLESLDINAQLKTADIQSLPYEENSFDFVLGWNSCHYMGTAYERRQFSTHIEELGRVLKPGGWIILSVPMDSNFALEAAEQVAAGYFLVKRDPYEIRNGQVMRAFGCLTELEQELSSRFTDIRTASLVDNCFGQQNHYYLAVAC